MRDVSINNRDNQVWITCIYEQGWDLIKHEDNLLQTRNQVFLGVFTFLLTVGSGVVSYILINLKVSTVESQKFNYLLAAYLFFAFSIIAFFLLYYWAKLTYASRSFVNLRRSILREIENKHYPDIVGIASKDQEMYESRPTDYIGAYKATFLLIKLFSVICIIIALLGVASLIFSYRM